MAEVKCPKCGKIIKLPLSYYDFEGDIKCENTFCDALFIVKIEKGMVKEARIKE